VWNTPEIGCIVWIGGRAGDLNGPPMGPCVTGPCSTRARSAGAAEALPAISAVVVKVSAANASADSLMLVVMVVSFVFGRPAHSGRHAHWCNFPLRGLPVFVTARQSTLVASRGGTSSTADATDVSRDAADDQEIK
jgi:hypothetical protein